MICRHLLSISLLLLSPALAKAPARHGNRAAIIADGVLAINGKRVFPIGFTMPPPPDGRTPEGKNGLAELRSAGATFLRTGVMGGPWDAAAIAKEQAWEDAAAKTGLYCMPFLRETASLKPGDTAHEAMLQRIVLRFKDHPGLGAWKGADEPQWTSQPVADVRRAYDTIHRLDPDHPVVLIHAPRGTVEELRAYNPAADVVGADVYPVSYPPGIHSLLPNKEISMVGDYTRTVREAGADRPVWMVLQIAWSGVTKPGKTLRFPTFPQERFMAYDAIVNGARGLFFFGGQIPKTLNARDAKLGWNWTFWQRVLKPVVQEIGDKGPLYPALVAPDSELNVSVSSASGMEFCVREAGGDVFLIACKREGPTEQATFTGLPAWAAGGDVLYEEPRRVTATAGTFTDWFAPFDVHVYRFRRSGA